MTIKSIILFLSLLSTPPASAAEVEIEVVDRVGSSAPLSTRLVVAVPDTGQPSAITTRVKGATYRVEVRRDPQQQARFSVKLDRSERTESMQVEAGRTLVPGKPSLVGLVLRPDSSSTEVTALLRP
jgi:hypothetical protein